MQQWAMLTRIVIPGLHAYASHLDNSDDVCPVLVLQQALQKTEHMPHFYKMKKLQLGAFKLASRQKTRQNVEPVNEDVSAPALAL